MILAGAAEASAEETSAVLAIQDAYYNRDYAQAKLLAADYLGKYPAGGARRAQAQGLMAGALVKRGEAQALVDFVEATLAAEPNHSLYAELRKAQGDALLAAMKQPGAAHEKYADALAHAAAESAVYENSLYRAGDALYRQAAAVDGMDTARFIDLSAQAEILMKQYLNLPARASVDPEAVKRRMVAQWRTKDYAAMQREAAWFQTDEGSLDGEAKAYCGIALFWAAEDSAHLDGGAADQVAALKAAGRAILTECLKDKTLRESRQMVEGYYLLGDYAVLKDAALRQLAKAAADDAETRIEMMKYTGIALYYARPSEPTGALKYFEEVMVEYDKNPKTLGRISVNAVYWGVTISLEQKDETRARAFIKRLPALPACVMKESLMASYQYLLD